MTVHALSYVLFVFVIGSQYLVHTHYYVYASTDSSVWLGSLVDCPWTSMDVNLARGEQVMRPFGG